MVLNLGECRRFGTMEDLLLEVGHTDSTSALEEVYFSITQASKGASDTAAV